MKMMEEKQAAELEAQKAETEAAKKKQKVDGKKEMALAKVMAALAKKLGASASGSDDDSDCALRPLNPRTLLILHFVPCLAICADT